MNNITKKTKINFIKKISKLNVQYYLDKHNIDRTNFAKTRISEAKVDILLIEVLDDIKNIYEEGIILKEEIVNGKENEDD